MNVEERIEKLEESVQNIGKAVERTVQTIEHIVELWHGLPKSPKEWQELLDEHEQELEGDA